MSYYVIKPAPQKEAEAKRILERMGYSVALPVDRVWARAGKGERKLREIVLMTGYLFVEADWLPIYQLRQLYCRNGRPLISGYVATAGGEPQRLPGEIVSRLMSIITPRSADYHKSLKVGDTVRTPQGLTGRIVGTKKHQAEVLTEMLGKLHTVSINVNKLEAA